MSRSSGASPDLLRVAEEIAASPVGADHPEQWLALLRRVIPFEAAWLGLLDDRRQRYTEVADDGYPDRIRDYFGSAAVAYQADLAGATTSPVPVRGRDLPAPMEEYPIWRDYYLPAGFKEGLAVGLFTPERRHIGLMVISTDDPAHPTDAERQLIGVLTPRIARAVDPLRSLAVLARVVHDALAGVVLTRVGDPLPLSGLPGHRLLAPGSALLAVARRQASEDGSVSFLWPVGPTGEAVGRPVGDDWAARDGLLRVQVLTATTTPTLLGVVVLAPLPDGRCVLNRRELVVLGLLLAGWTDQRIAVGLALPLRTVVETVARAMFALEAPDRHVGLVRAARAGGSSRISPIRPRRADRRRRRWRWLGSHSGTWSTICYLSRTSSTNDGRCSMATLPVLPLTDAVLLPGMVIPVTLDATTQSAVDAARATGDKKLLAVPRVDGEYGSTGVIATIEKVGRLPSGEPAAVVRGLSRARIGSGVPGPGAALWVEATELTEPAPAGKAKELAREYRALVTSLLQERGAWQVIDAVERMTDLSELADSAGYAPWLTLEQKIELLGAADVTARLELLVGWVKDYLAEQEVTERINNDVREGLEKSQREFLLRQQLAAIRKELGEDEPDGSADYRSRVDSADLPEKVREAALREVGKLERASDASPEAGWIRTWLDTVLEMPWNTRTEDNTDLAQAREVLDADHAGLADVKDRILEYLAVRNRRAARNLQVVGGRGSGAVLALAGPPGVGKTSLGESVARALGRKFVRVSLGGVRDEAEIRGHRRTYVGALPGRIVRALREAGSMNPVVLLDEVDKLSVGYAGDPAAALLEVLDPAQNHTFRDHYLEVDLDLSDVLFLATANVVEAIPGPLLDRMELVTLDGYTEEEKVAIGRDHLLPRQVERAGLTADEVSVSDEALAAIAAEHTREAGVRQLERALAKILRKVAVALESTEAPIRVDTDNLASYLGRPKFTPESAERTAVPGVATGLAVTGAGGDVLFIEATSMEGEPGLTLTGQLGDVMKESAQIALSYLRSNGRKLGLDPNALAGRRIHLHVPAGAVPKDGPSAGITMVTALASLASGRPVRPEFGMTGEVTLSGRVLPIGGVKQKLLAAHRAGLTEVIIPARNEPDLDDLPAEVREALTAHTLADVADVLALALRPADEVGDLGRIDGPALAAA